MASFRLRKPRVQPLSFDIRFSRRTSVLIFLGLGLGTGVGCNRQLGSATGRAWWQPKSAYNYMRVALESENPDIRRQALAKVIESRNVSADWAFAGLAAIARHDSNAQVRCVALRGLGRYRDPRPVAVVLEILDSEGQPNAVRAPSAQVRWESLRVLNHLGTRSLISTDQREAVLEVIGRNLDPRYDRNVRRAAAEGLKHIQDRQALTFLIDALRDPDFGVVLEAERSLSVLTGTTHDFDPDGWNDWLARTDEPFAQAGRPIQILEPPKQTWWEKTKGIFRR